MLGNNLSLSDIAAVTDGNKGDGFFGSNGLWAVICLAIIFGWNNGGYGVFGGGRGANESTSVYEGYVLNNDFSQLSKQISDSYSMTERKLDGLNNGICSLGYDQLAQMNGINTNIMSVGNAIQTQLADCCCKTQQNIADVKYTIGSTASDTNFNISTQANMLDRGIADGFCKTNFNNQTNTRDIIDSQRDGTQAILSKLDAMETSRLREKLEAERDARYALQGQLDRAQLRTDIVNDVRPCPIPAFNVPNPFCSCNCNNTYGYGTTIA